MSMSSFELVRFPTAATRRRGARRRPHALARAAALCLVGAWLPLLQAQTRTPEVILIQASPLGTASLAAPVSVLSGDELVQRRAASLGETLDGLPGVSSTYFGPQANRPVLRGLDGERVRMLNNGGGSMDASSLSFDHALPIDPLVLTRVEVLRGPAALFHGGSAIGGVVNTVDNRIPLDPVQGLGGAAELRWGGAARERGGAVVLDAGNGQLAWHADAFGRSTSDLQVPAFSPEPGAAPVKRVANSGGEARGAALGGSLFLGPARLGLSVDHYANRYGVVVEPDLLIDMKRDHVGLSAELRQPRSAWQALRLNANFTDYLHREIEGDGAVGTIFSSRGQDLRLEAQHAPLGPLRGVLGAQWEDFDFRVQGDEAFVPATRTQRGALFLLEEWQTAGGQTTAGLRLERVQLASDGDSDPLGGRFGPASQRRFSLHSLSLSHQRALDAGWSLVGSLSWNQRAPSHFELYANGVHAATAAYEQGDTTLPAERGQNLELALAWQQGDSQWRAGVFRTRFSRFIHLAATGGWVDEDGQAVAPDSPDGFPLFRFGAVRARLQGLEVQGRQRLLTRPWSVDALFSFDSVRATDADSGEPLPRVAPWRLSLGLQAQHGPWMLGGEVRHAARQSRVPQTDQPTAASTLVNLNLSRRFDWGGQEALWLLRLGNVGNRLATSATSVATLRELSPLPGRALSTGLRLAF